MIEMGVPNDNGIDGARQIPDELVNDEFFRLQSCEKDIQL